MQTKRLLQTIGLPCLLLAGLALASADASAAAPSNQSKRFRFHGDLDVLSFTHFNPDGNGRNDNTIGFGIGRVNGVDATIALPTWSLGLGYVFLDGNAVVGAKVAFNLSSRGGEEDPGTGPAESRDTTVGGQLIPYFRYIFMQGSRARPYLEGRFGFGGSTFSSVIESDPESRTTTNVIYPAVGLGGGAHIFIVDAFSVDLGLNFDYLAPHSKTREEIGNMTTDEDFSKNGDLINLAANVGFSAWF